MSSSSHISHIVLLSRLRSLLLIALVSVTWGSKTAIASNIIIEAESIEIRKNTPTLIVFELDRGEQIAIKSKILGKRNEDDISIELYDMNTQDPTLVKSLGPIGRFACKRQGNYMLRLSTDKRNVQLNLKVESQLSRSIPENTEYVLFKCPSIYINEAEIGGQTIGTDQVNKEISLKGNTTQFLLSNLQKGDKVGIQCSDKDAGILKATLLQTAESQWLAQSASFEIPEDGDYSIDLYVDQSSLEKSGFNWFSGEDFSFEDFKFTLYRPLTNPAQSKINTQEENPDPMALLSREFEKNREVQKRIREDEKREREKNQKLQQEESERMEQMWAKMIQKNTYYEPTVDQDDISIRLDPLRNIKGEHCACKEIKVFEPEKYLWFYWIGVDSKADSIFAISEEENGPHTIQFENGFRRRFQQDSSNLQNYRAMRKMMERQFPDPASHSDHFQEHVEYFFVNEINKEYFLEGKDFELYFRVPESKVSQDIQILPIPTETLWLCARSLSQYSSANIVVHYYTLDPGITTR